VTIAASSANLLCSACAFTGADVGKAIFVPGAGSGGSVLSTYILTQTDATHVVLVNNASTTLTASTKTVSYGQPTPDGKHPTTPYHIIHGTTWRTVLSTFPTSDPIPSVLPPVLNPYDAEPQLVLSNGNLTATQGGSTKANVRGTTGVAAGKYCWRVTNNTGTSLEVLLSDLTGDLSTDNNAHILNYNGSGFIGFNGQLSPNLPTYTTGNAIDVAIDATNLLASFRVVVSGTPGNWNGNVANNPATGAYALSGTGKFAAGTVIYPGVSLTAVNDSASINFTGCSPMPAGYSSITGGGL
jgi:hypothetical protein